MTELRRVRSGPFHLDSALSLDELSRLHRERGLSRHIIPPREALHNIPSAYVDTRVERKIRNGGSIRAEDCSSIHIGDEVPAGRVKIISRTHNTLVAVAELRSQRTASAVGRTGAAVPTWKTLRVFAHHSALEPESQQRCACHA
jgi:tRNA U55 pseudouridine synthase TruB